MEHIGVIGLSWRQGGADALARFALPTEEGALHRLRDAMGATELVYLGTCNRVEIYFTVDDAAKMSSMRSLAFEALTGSPGEPGEERPCLRRKCLKWSEGWYLRRLKRGPSIFLPCRYLCELHPVPFEPSHSQSLHCLVGLQLRLGRRN